MPPSEDTSLTELIAPPAGYRFHAGIWMTHDLDWTALCDLVAPALAGVTTTGPRRIQETRAEVHPTAPGLVVLHAGRDTFTAGPVLPWASEVAIDGRRQHAKLAVLQYRSDKGQHLRTKALVTSANLTRLGLVSNLEVVTWDEIGQGSGPFLGKDLLTEVIELAKRLPAPPTPLTRVIKALKVGIASAKKTQLLRSSLNDQHSMIPERRHYDAPARTIVIVSPAFAGNSDTRAAKALSRWCEPGTEVHIHTEFRGTADQAAKGKTGLVLSAGLVKTLEKTGAKVTKYAVPTQTDNDAPVRRLHAKAIAIIKQDQSAWVLTGSANCTGPGLYGENRELMVCQSATAAKAEAIISGLGAVPYEGIPIPPKPKQPKPTTPPAPVVTATFEIDPAARSGERSWPGTLTVEVDGEHTSVRYGSIRLKPGTPTPVLLDAERGSVQVRVGGKLHQIQIQVEVPAGHSDFWMRITPEAGVDRPDQGLLRLLADVKQATTAKGTKGSKAPKGPGVGDDGYRIPLSQRLVLLARHRTALRGLTPEEVDALLGNYVDSRSAHEIEEGVRRDEIAASRRVVTGIHCAYYPTTPGVGDALFDSLSGAVNSFDELRDAAKADQP